MGRVRSDVRGTRAVPRWLRLSIVVAGTATLVAIGPGVAQACAGADLARTLKLMDALQQEGVKIALQCANSFDAASCTLQALLAMQARYAPLIAALPPSCQIAFQGGGGGGGGTQCVGGVCCDSTGCY